MLKEGKIIAFMGLEMHAWNMRETLERIQSRIEAGKATRHTVINVAKLVNARRDAALKASIEACDIVNIDGMPIVWGARLCGNSVPERVAGIDLMEELLSASVKQGWRIYVLGATQDVLAEGIRRIQERWRGICIAGSHYGYFKPDEAGRIADEVAESNADVLFVAMSTPRKEEFIERWGNRTKAKFVMGVGGALDVLAGETRRAPRWMRDTGLEWFFRLIQEPRRMVGRYAKTNTLFLLYFIKEFMGRNH